MTGKTQVALKVKITIPRMELVAAVNSIRLARKVREVLKIPIAGKDIRVLSTHIQLLFIFLFNLR